MTGVTGPVFRLDSLPNEYLAIGQGQWLYWYVPAFHDVKVHVCAGDRGRLVIDQLHVKASGRAAAPSNRSVTCHAIDPSSVRELTLGRLETLINSPAVSEAILGDVTSPNLSPEARRLPSAASLEKSARPVAGSEGLSLEIPSTYRKTDEFYAQVARLFEAAAQASTQPAIDIANANGLPKTTVHRWIREARRRGVMKPTRTR